jgi:hypothetical protein
MSDPTLIAAQTVSALEQTLQERGSRYGTLANNGYIAQELKAVFRRPASNWQTLSPDKREALDVIASKMARILTGDPEYTDNWHDIAGYATLVEKEIHRKQAEKS